MENKQVTKVKRTPTQLKKHYKRLQYLFTVLEFVSVLLPILIIYLVKKDTYFVEYNGTKITIAFIISMIVVGIMLALIIKKKLKNSLASVVVGWFVVDLIFFLMGKAIEDISFIMLFCGIGLAVAYGFDIAANKMKQNRLKVIAAIEKAKQDRLAEEYKKEEDNKKDTD